MDRIIGIDYGRKRVGVAVSDPLGIFASALETVHSAKIIEGDSLCCGISYQYEWSTV